MAAVTLEIAGSGRVQLLGYVARQLETFFPDGRAGERELMDLHLDGTLARLAQCIEGVRAWAPGRFDPLHTSQYATFLYLLSNEIWLREGADPLCAKLFALNKALNGIDLFYEILLPKVFLLGHTVGVVLAKATYGEHLVLLQNSTVGRDGEHAPTLGEGAILYPNSAVIGRSVLGPRTTLSQGACLIHQDTPGDCLVFRQNGPRALIKPAVRRHLEEYFRGL